MATINEWIELMVWSEKMYENCEHLDEVERKKYKETVDKYWTPLEEDREIVLEDLNKDGGFIYKKMYEWCELLGSEEHADWDMAWSAWEYSLEDYLRDMFGNETSSDKFGVFEIPDINKMVYGKDYNEDEE